MHLRMKITLYVLLIGAVRGVGFGQVVEIPDSNLQRAVKEALNLPNDSQVTAQDMRQLTGLNAQNTGIESLDGLEYATDLRRLWVNNNPLSDLSPISNCSKLEDLGIGGCGISDISALQGLVNLIGVNIGGNSIHDLQPLKPLINLEHLLIYQNPVSDITPLVNLRKLIRLWAWNCQITDISALQYLSELTELNLAGNQIVDIAPLVDLTELTTLLLDSNNIADVSPLANLTQLTTLGLGNNNIADISPLANLVNLERLELQNNRIRDITPLESLTHLEHLDTQNNPIFDADSPVVDIPDPNLRRAVKEALNLPNDSQVTAQDMRRLTGLNAQNTGIESLDGLEYATDLRRLWVDSNPLSDLSPISNCSKLEDLGIGGCGISDISALQGLVNLLGVNIGGNSIHDLQPLKPLINLEHLLMYQNPVSDITPLVNLRKLKRLWAWNCQITDISALQYLSELTELNLAGNQIVDIAPLVDLTQITRLSLNHNRIVDVSPLSNLTKLKSLEIQHNNIGDHSPLDVLSLTHFKYDQSCEMPPLPLKPRLENRTFPSVFSAWGGLGWSSVLNQPHLSDLEQMSQHDLYFCCLMFGEHLIDTGDGWEVRGDLEGAEQLRDDYIALNSNMVFLVQIEFRAAQLSVYPEDWPYWLRDTQGEIVKPSGEGDPAGLIDFTNPGFQDRMVAQAVAVSECGLYDGIMIDWWNDKGALLVTYNPYTEYRGHEVEMQAKINILEGIRAQTRPDFLIIGNVNRDKLPRTGKYINGGFMETGTPSNDSHVGGIEEIERGLQKIESTLQWAEQNMREPRINALEGWGFPTEPLDSPTNLRWMRTFTTLSLTHSDGYVLYNDGIYHSHYWYDFWDADLGRPVGSKFQLYDEEIPGLYIREFTNGWAVYNHSGDAQVITLPEKVQGVASGLVNTEHALPNLDGEMYLRVKPKNPADVNGDGVVNILDLTIIARGLGTDSLEADVNGDGLVNILDLVFVANAF